MNEHLKNFKLDEKLIKKISSDKNEPNWMLQKRLKAFEVFKKLKLPSWAPDLKELDLTKINFYVDLNVSQKSSWKKVPQDIKDTFDKLGIVDAEKKYFSGVGAQYDSKMIYHNLKKEWKKKGVIFENMDDAIHKYPLLVKKYFMTNCVNIFEHKFSALHCAVWSGGTFIYVPKNVKVEIPLQAYFRMNQAKGGQFEHTLIIADEGSEVHYIEGCSAPNYSQSSLHAGCVEIFVKKNSKMIYSSIENWSKNVFNLNTKRAIVYENGTIEWLNGNVGSKTTMLYPCSILLGDNSKSESLGIAFANKGQNQDTGNKVIHIGKNTSSVIRGKAISKNGGTCTYRGIVKIHKLAHNTQSIIDCGSIIDGKNSISKAFPLIENENKSSLISHEASVGKINEQSLFYLMSKGMNEDTAKQMIIGGFLNPIIKKLPMEYALELNRLIDLEMENG